MKIPLNALNLVRLCLAAQVVFTAQYLGYHSFYSFNSNYLHAPTWMTPLPNSTSLTSLSIPGTHDTMTNVRNGEIYQCQNHHLSTQLESGLRYFDIRARLNNDELLIYHQDSYTGSSYVNVLKTFFAFLAAHPGESILMRLKEESTPINSTIGFETAFNRYRLQDPRTAAGCAKYFWDPSQPEGGDGSDDDESNNSITIPTLGALRSKILILQNFGTEPARYGIKWESPLLDIQDDYEIPDLYEGLDRKFEAITDGLERAGNGTAEGDGLLYLGHLSGSVGVLPIQAAAGTREGDVVGMNDRTGDWLKKAGNGGKTGVVIIDFPGRELVREVLIRN